MQRAVVGRAVRRLSKVVSASLAGPVIALLPCNLLSTLLPAVGLGILLLAGCHTDPAPLPRDATDATLFGPASMRLHPIFTQVKDWTGDGIPDGIEALVELQDQFGDPTKASGHVIFDLYQYKKYDPQRKGQWLVEWQADLSTLEAQRDYWNRTSRTYGFQLADGAIALDQNYVLTAEFQLNNGGRLFDQLVIEAQVKPEKMAAPDYGLPPSPTTAPALPLGGSSSGDEPATAPVVAPGMRTPQP